MGEEKLVIFSWWWYSSPLRGDVSLTTTKAFHGTNKKHAKQQLNTQTM